VKSVSDYLHHLLLSYHEYNNNMVSKSRAAFICTPDFGLAQDALDFVPETNRVKYYSMHGVGNEFILKNYSTQPLFDPAVEHFDKLGITIMPEVEEEETVMAPL
jgi:hypothetical protein